MFEWNLTGGSRASVSAWHRPARTRDSLRHCADSLWAAGATAAM